MLALGLAVTLAAWAVERENVKTHERIRFEGEARRIQLLTRDRLNLYIDMLNGARGLFMASKSVERDEWQAFIRFNELRHRYAGIERMGFIQRVAPDEKEKFAAEVRADTSINPAGYPDFQIYPSRAEGDLFPVKYREPMGDDPMMLGFDMASDPVRLEAMEHARDTGQPAVTAPTRLVSDPDKAPGFLLFLPVYRNGQPAETLEQRRIALSGFVYSTIKAESFLRTMMSDERITANIDIEIFDQEQGASVATPGRLIVDSDRHLDAGQNDRPVEFTSVLYMQVANRTWAMYFHALPGYTSGRVETFLPLILLVIGIVISLLLFGIVYSLTNTRRHAQILARVMNKELEESRDRLEEMIRQARDPIVTVDLLGFLRQMNPAAESIIGYEQTELLGKHFSSLGLMTSDSLKTALKEFALVLAGQTRPPYELQMRHKSGREIVVEASAALVKLKGRPSSIQVIFRDMTERKKIEAELRQLSVAVEQSPVSIVITDLKGLIVYVNQKFETSSGYTRAEVIGQNPRILKSGQMKPEEYRKLWLTISSGKQWTGRFHNRRKDGTLYWESSVIMPITADDGHIVQYIAIKEDITEKLSLESQLIQAQKMETVGTLAGGIAHDLNNSLTPVLGYLDLLMTGCKPDDPAYQYLAQAAKAATRCADTVNGLLRFSRPATREKEVMRTGRLLGEFQVLLRTVMPRHVKRKLACPEDVWNVLVNETEMHTVLMNLTTNARDAIGEREGIFSIEASNAKLDAGSRGALKAGDYVRISVSDDGAGIDPADLPRIFDPFFTTKAKGKGTGLGLAMVFSIIKEHGGWIQVSSRVGEGSTFDIYLPKAKGEPALSADTISGEGLPRGSGTVLVVDDEDSVRSFAISCLEGLGYSVLPAASGEEALQVYQRAPGRIQAVLLDMVMPGMTGKETMRKILELDPNARIVLVSGFTQEGTKEELIASGAKAFLHKPFLVRPLAEALRRALDAG